MKHYLKLALLMMGPAGIARLLPAADATTTYSIPTTNSSPPPYNSPMPLAAFSSNAVLVAANAQISLLKEMLVEHQKRAADLSQKSQTEKASWETELVNELQEKITRLQKGIDEMIFPGSAINNVKAIGSTVDEQFIFMSTLEARLQQVRDELTAVTGQSATLQIQLATKTTAEDIAAFSSAIGDRQRLINGLQREQFDLELRKLEFRAIQKALRK